MRTVLTILLRLTKLYNFCHRKNILCIVCHRPAERLLIIIIIMTATTRRAVGMLQPDRRDGKCIF